MKILILGAGGVGGYFGARLLKAGADVTYLLREKRQAKILAEGLIIETPTETFAVQPKTITREQLKPEYDLIVLAPKSFDFEDALASLEGASAKGVYLHRAQRAHACRCGRARRAAGGWGHRQRDLRRDWCAGAAVAGGQAIGGVADAGSERSARGRVASVWHELVWGLMPTPAA